MIPVILSGGSGTRLWPVSRTSLPKQFALFFKDSLLAKTLKRLQKLGSPYVITHVSMKTLTEKAYREASLPLNQIILEPLSRNTAPAIALLCKKLEFEGKLDSIVGVFPSDHLIDDEGAFIEALKLAEKCAEAGMIVTLGMRPTYPATGYGYIEVDREEFQKSGKYSARVTRGFREKPDAETAQRFLDEGHFFWNGGIFVFKARVLLAHFEAKMPALFATMGKLKSDLSNLAEVYAECASESIDYGIMEKTKEQVCIPCELGWSDIGSWDELLDKIKSTVSPQNLYEQDAHGSRVFSRQDKVYAFVGTEDLTIVDTPDALLITKKGASQKVKELAEQLKQRKETRLTEHPFEYRPWGYFEVLKNTPNFKSKVIQIEPGQRLSYQSHTRRAEHWVIIKGEAEITLNDETLKRRAGESVYIPLGAKHRIHNVGQSLLEFVEVQTGTYFGEDDIQRYQDDYSRS